ncbi:DNRLRE domain-containing protein [bacterium]|nr:DNRLRE domain-containing protein [bacterium]
MKLKLLVLTSAALLLLTACDKQSDSPLGNDLDSRGNQPVHTLVIEPGANWSDTGIYGFGNTEGKTVLSVGRVGDTVVRSLIDFDLDEMPGAITAETLYRARVEYHYTRAYSVANWRSFSRGELEVSVHRLTSDWEAEYTTWLDRKEDDGWGAQGGEFADAQSAFLLDEIDNGIVETRTFDVTELMADWLDDPAAEFGLLLKAADETNADVIKEFYSDDLANSEMHPHLHIIYEGGDGEKYAWITEAEEDVTIARNLSDGGGNADYGSDELLPLSASFGTGGWLLFDFALDLLPENATINLAQLELYASFPGRSYDGSAAIHAFEEEFTDSTRQADLRKLDYEEVKLLQTLTAQTDGYLKLQIAPIFQDWNSNEKENHGLLIKIDDNGDYAEPITIYTGDTTDPDKQPRLTIKYTLPPEHWY